MEKAKRKNIKQGSKPKVVALAEPVMLYETMELSDRLVLKKETNNIILSEKTDKPEASMTAFEKMEMVKTGLTKKDIEMLKQKASLDYDDLAYLLSVTRATLINKKGDEKFSPVLSERVIAIADIYSYGLEIFEDSELLNDWIIQSNRALGGNTPFSLMNTQFGREEVRNIIGRIAYGVYS
jgi:putative toxin-antitoxin system antitoxin component (TIGR02293 family)